MDNLKYILDGVCETLNIDKEDIISRKRHQHIIDARIIYTAIAINNTGETLSNIGSQINRDHTMSIHYRGKHKMYIETDKRYKQKYNLCLYVAASIPNNKDEKCIIDRLMKRNSILSEKYRYEKAKREELEHRILRMKSKAHAGE